MMEGKKEVKDTSVCTIVSQSSVRKRVNATVITSAEARLSVLFSSQCLFFFFFLIVILFLPETNGDSLSDCRDDMI